MLLHDEVIWVFIYMPANVCTSTIHSSIILWRVFVHVKLFFANVVAIWYIHDAFCWRKFAVSCSSWCKDLLWVEHVAPCSNHTWTWFYARYVESDVAWAWSFESASHQIWQFTSIILLIQRHDSPTFFIIFKSSYSSWIRPFSLSVKGSLILQPPPIPTNTPNLLAIIIRHWIVRTRTHWINSMFLYSLKERLLLQRELTEPWSMQ